MIPPDAASPPFDPDPIGAWVRAALDSSLRERAPDQREAFWKAVALGYGGISTSPPAPRPARSPAPDGVPPVAGQA
ncbi:hypothetical protein ASF49_21235 [Methylobacterium sp. Leaf104]|uniref:hypothetical protein n=1 Tax=Methylobacterium TaxID=407 RepID=UPI0006FBB459|nr:MULTISPECIES: hypothetical protein [Methylobacterium]KQP40319.1 hypothetical protein ASF49_21235 [Methylobacterium sp. Leaf104]MCI9882690.1 hypothetical protein [Methylobacterium goesingense]